MAASPEDLVKCWHLVVAQGREPVSWKLPEWLWQQVRQAAAENAPIDAGDHLCIEDDRMLLGTPVEIAGDPELAPVLYLRDGAKLEAVPIIGPLEEA